MLRKLIFPFFVNFGIIIFDRFFKTFALTITKKTEILPLFYFTRYENTGIVFSIPLPQFIILIATGCIITFLAYLALKGSGDKGRTFALLLILFGALSNFYDRMKYGFVIDYFNIFFPFWVFNIADAMIFFGLCSLAFQIKKENKSISQ